MISFEVGNTSNQRFSAVLNGRRVSIRLWYSVYSDRWSLDLAIDKQSILNGRRLVAGVDILEAFDFGVGAIFIWPDTNPNRDALSKGLVKIYSASDAEVVA